MGRPAADFPHHKLVYHYFHRWTADGTLSRMHNHLREQVRRQVEGRDAQPTAALVDSQSLRGAETVARSTGAGQFSSDGAKLSVRSRSNNLIAVTPTATRTSSYSRCTEPPGSNL